MKALTIWQPWASLIMVGAKPYEFRRWPAPAGLVGQRIVIHAGARPVKHREVVELMYRVEREGGRGTGLETAPAMELLERIASGRNTVPLASGLGTALLGKPRKATALFGGTIADSDRVDEHIWAWPLSAIEFFEPFVPARGAQGFWHWPAGRAA